MLKQFILMFLVTISVYGITITENTTLTEDTEYFEDVVIQGALLDVGRFTLTVNGDLNITGSYGRLQMNKVDSKVIVNGNILFAGASTYGNLIDGEIIVSGDFTQKGTGASSISCGCCGDTVGNRRDSTNCSARYLTDNAYSFYPTGKHKVVLNGNNKQIVHFQGASYSRFNNLKIENSSEDGVIFKELNVVGEWDRNGKKVHISNIRNLTLTEDYTIPNNILVKDGTLNLNTYKLLVQGDMNATSARVEINNGILTVDKSLRFTGKNSRLRMVKHLDEVIVKGDLLIAGASTYNDLIIGTIKLAGNFTQKGTEFSSISCGCCGDTVGNRRDSTNCSARYLSNNAYSFYPTGKHKVILNGDKEQFIDFQAGNHSHFNNLEIQNKSEDGVVFEELSVIGEWKRNENNVRITDIRNLKLTEDYTINEDIKMENGTLNLNGFNLTINGNMDVISGKIKLDSNVSLIVNGDLSFSGNYSRLFMNKPKDKVVVKEDISFGGASTYQDLTNGTIEVYGDFTQKGTGTSSISCGCCGWTVGNRRDSTNCSARYLTNNAYSFYPTGNHKVIFKGTSTQDIKFDAPDYSHFQNLEIENENVRILLNVNKKLKVLDTLYTSQNLYNLQYEDNEFINVNRIRFTDFDYLDLNEGLYMIALPNKNSIQTEDIETLFNDKNISYITKYNQKNKAWESWSSSEKYIKKINDNNISIIKEIKAGEGFFISTISNVELKFPTGEAYSIFDIKDISNLETGWHLLGSNETISFEELFEKNSNILVVWYLIDNKWVYFTKNEELKEEYKRRNIGEFNSIKTKNSSFWVYIQ